MDIDISPVNNRYVNVSYYINFVKEKLATHSSLVKNREYKRIASTSSHQNNFKIFFEEMVPLMFFLQRQDHNYQKIKYMAGDQVGDAIVDEKTIIEITMAKNSGKYLVTKDMLDHGFAF